MNHDTALASAMVITTGTLAGLVERSRERKGLNADLLKEAFDPLARQAWYLILIHQTLAYAEATVPHYREKFGREWPRAAVFERLSDLAKFPVLNKADVVAKLPSFLSEQVESQTVHCTSGTTFKRLQVYGNYDEERAVDLLRQLRNPPDMHGGLPLRIVPGPRRLYSPTHHGIGGPGLVLGYSSNQDNHQWFDYTDYLAEVLNGTYWFGREARRIGSVHITPPWMLEFITRKFMDRGIDPSEFKVGAIGISGGFTTARTVKIVEQVWRAKYTSSYSCTEVASGAALEYRDAPGVYRPGPSLYCEIVDPDTHEPVDYGEHGIVLLTSLYPFQQVMPFIRYNTGDIAERVLLDDDAEVEAEVDCGVSALRPIGRTGDCLHLGRRKYFGTREVLDALAPFDEIPHVPYPRYELELAGNGESRIIRLRAETVEISEEKRESLRTQIQKNLVTHYELNPFSDEIPLSFECTLVAKDTLLSYPRLVPSR